MCTAATYKTKDLYFGRTLDYEFSYKEEVTITPRNYELKFKNKEAINRHYAIMYFLLKWCKLEKVTPNREIKLSFKGKVVFDKRINSPEVFKLTLNDANEIEEIENIPFDDLEFDDFNK